MPRRRWHSALRCWRHWAMQNNHFCSHRSLWGVQWGNWGWLQLNRAFTRSKFRHDNMCFLLSTPTYEFNHFFFYWGRMGGSRSMHVYKRRGEEAENSEVCWDLQTFSSTATKGTGTIIHQKDKRAQLLSWDPTNRARWDAGAATRVRLHQSLLFRLASCCWKQAELMPVWSWLCGMPAGETRVPWDDDHLPREELQSPDYRFSGGGHPSACQWSCSVP